MDREEEFARRDRLLVEARRIGARAHAHLAHPGGDRGAAARLALADDLTRLLARLNGEKAAIAGEMARGKRVSGAVNAYARALGAAPGRPTPGPRLPRTPGR